MQVLKLLVARNVAFLRYIVLDANNHFDVDVKRLSRNRAGGVTA